jgi:hypothetical protein
MKYKAVFALLLLLFFAIPSQAPAGDNRSGIGAGIIIGEPTGLDGKFWLSSATAIQSAVAWSTSNNASLHFTLDYTVHKWGLIDVERGSLPIYFGVGGRLRLRDGRDDDVGVRIPIGLVYQFANDPFDIFLEVVPIMDLAPDTDFSANVALGARLFF